MKTKEKAKVEDLNYYETNGRKYYLNKKSVVLDYSNKEKEIALFLASNIGVTICMVPKINYPKGIKTPDYIWNNEKWDLKEIRGSGKTTIEDSLKRNKEQANNFVIDISKPKLTAKDSEKQIKKLNDILIDFVKKDKLKYLDSYDGNSLKKNANINSFKKRFKEATGLDYPIIKYSRIYYKCVNTFNFLSMNNVKEVILDYNAKYGSKNEKDIFLVNYDVNQNLNLLNDY